MALKKLPVGIENFSEFYTENFYYVDKTGLIIDLLHSWGKVNLFTRPRRFGKSLNMNMLQTFFEIGCKQELFEGLAVTQEKELCEKYMGQFPVVSVTLKNVAGRTFEAARDAMKYVIGREAGRLSILGQSDKLSEEEKNRYKALVEVGTDGSFSMSDTLLENSLLELTAMLSKHYDRKVILLIDEYDVPLDKAFQEGYYDEMVSLIRNLFSNVLKTNNSLQFAVLTGCLRISKESIFTGLNNLNVITITDELFDEYFGFTDKEVKELLAYYDLTEKYDTIKEWYDGYRIGSASIYCPWDVIKYCYALRANRNASPENYWSNTSSNSIIRRFINMASQQTKDEIEQLIAGESITKPIAQELTYRELDNTIEHLWSVLFTTGYLTQKGQRDEERYELVIPNREIRNLFVTQIKEWFKETSTGNTAQIEKFCAAFPAGESDVIEEMLDDYLWNSISIRDTAVREPMKENFYHGLLLGLLEYKQNWKVKSNAESGEGYSDILIETQERTGVVVEIKYAQDGNLDRGCAKALEQMDSKQYDALLRDDGMKKIVRYGIAFYKKSCKVIAG
jgi:hypothetical protein